MTLLFELGLSMADPRRTLVKQPVVGAPRLGRTTVAALAVIASGVSHAALALPSGASVQRGEVRFTHAPNLLTVNQSSNDAIIDWSSFSIEAAGTVQFNNGSGATLNRVTGSDVSTIDGLLNATGSVYLINPNGVIIGKTGEVNIGGTFVASTLNLIGNNLDGATKIFKGLSEASVINLGSISALGGDVVLMASNVKNSGSISAPNGDIGLLAGSSILISDVATDDGKFSVQIGGPGTSAVNEGALQAAIVELRANQGNVYALAGNTTGVINATAISTGGGEVFLVAEDGDTVVKGTITATGPVGTIGGQVTTAGVTVGIQGANVTAGNWTIQQDHFVLTPEAATVLAANLATTSITVRTVGAGATGDISLASSLSWSGYNSLTFSSRRNIVFRDGVTLSNTGYGGVELYADNEGHGVGTVSFGAGANISTDGLVSILYDPPGNINSSVNSFSYTVPTDFSAYISAGYGMESYMLVNTVYDLQNIQNNLSGDYILGRNINAAVTASWNGGAGFNPIGAVENSNQSPYLFTGFLTDENPSGGIYVISNLTINQPASNYVGLFADIGTRGAAAVSLKGGSVTGAGFVGAIAGENDGSISDSYSNLTVTGVSYAGQDDIGGLVGVNTGVVAYSRAAGSVTGYGAVGGIAGLNYYQPGSLGYIIGSIASGDVTAGGYSYAGGLVGLSETGNSEQTLNSNSNGSWGDGYSSAVLQSDRASGIVIGTEFVGGLAGVVDGTIVSSSSASGYVYSNGAFAAGGLIGVLGNVQTATVQYSHASGNVLNGAYAAGGLIGYVDEANDANSGGDVVSNVFSTGSVTSSGYGGGLIGIFGLGLGYNNPTLTNAYATGNVSGTGALGGLIGYSSGTVTYAYWNTNTTGQSTDGAQATVAGDPTTGSIGLSGVDFWSTVKALPGGF